MNVTNLIWHSLGPADLPEGEPRAYTVAEVRYCLIREGERVYAVADKCTHGQAFLSDGLCDLAEGTLECPLHAGLFNFRTGAVAGAPARRPVQSYPAEIRDGELYLGLPE